MGDTYEVFAQKRNHLKMKKKPLKFVFGNAQGRVSVESTVLPIWINDAFRPARVRLVDGMAELLLCLEIIRGLDIAVVFGSNQFRVGQGESEMVTYNGKHHWVFPPSPNCLCIRKTE